MDPFVAVPQRLAEFLRPHLDDIAAEVAREVQLQVPEYTRPADDAYVRTIRAGVRQALTLFVDRIADTGREGDTSSTPTRRSGVAKPAKGAVSKCSRPRSGSVDGLPGGG